MVIRLATLDGERVRPQLVTTRNTEVPSSPPQKILDMICSACFKFRPQFLESISSVEPFDKDRAFKIMNIMLNKGMYDPKSYSLGSMIRRNWNLFSKLD